MINRPCLAVLVCAFALPLHAQPADDSAPSEPVKTPSDETAPAEHTAQPDAQPAPAPAAPPPGPRVLLVRPPVPDPSPSNGAGDPRLDQVSNARAADDPNLPSAERVGQKPWLVLLGGRTMLVSDAGLDPFADTDQLSQFSLGFGRSIYARDVVSVAAMGFWDVGSRSSSARGEPTRLIVHRLALGPELRIHPLTDLYAFTRFAPALIHSEARLEESTTRSVYYARSDDVDLDFLGSWDFGFDATAGAAYELFGSGGRRKGALRFWAMVEGGYAWATSGELELSPDAGDASAPERVAALDLGSLALRGPMFRAALGASF